MPIYNFKCKSCENTQSKMQKFDAPPPPCEKCGKETERVLAQGSFILKGAGWFKTGGY